MGRRLFEININIQDQEILSNKYSYLKIFDEQEILRKNIYIEDSSI